MTWDASLIDGPISIEGDSGYHLNIAPEIMTPELEAFRVEPATPDRVFAGAETVFLRFANEAEAKQELTVYWIEE